MGAAEESLANWDHSESVKDRLWLNYRTYLSLSKVNPRLKGQAEVASHVTIHKERTAILRTRYEYSFPSGCRPTCPALANALGSPITTMKMFTTSTVIPKITLHDDVAESVLLLDSGKCKAYKKAGRNIRMDPV